MSFTGKYAGIFYIPVYIKLNIGKDVDSANYLFGVLYYNTGTWYNCGYDTIPIYSGYPENVYDHLSN